MNDFNDEITLFEECVDQVQENVKHISSILEMDWFNNEICFN